jgi:hypothetical protein
MVYICATAGFAGRSWPHEMSLQDNLRDLERHAQDLAVGLVCTARVETPRARSGPSWHRDPSACTAFELSDDCIRPAVRDL